MILEPYSTQAFVQSVHPCCVDSWGRGKQYALYLSVSMNMFDKYYKGCDRRI